MASLTKQLWARMSAADKIRAMYTKNLPKKPESHHILSEKEVAENKKLFGYFDRNRDNHLDSKEYSDLVRFETNYTLNANLEEVFRRADKDGDGKISVNEFLTSRAETKAARPSHNTLRRYFDSCDVNNDGHIGYEEFKLAWYQMGENANGPNLRSMFTAADTNGDKQITRSEFVDIALRHWSRNKIPKRGYE